MDEDRKLLTVRQFVQKYSFISEGSLRFMIFNSKHNGLGDVILRMGRRILMDEKRFFAWLEGQNKPGVISGCVRGGVRQ